MKVYQAYKDSGFSWLGRVPEHWVLNKAKYIFNKMERPPREEDGVVTAFRDGMVTLRTNRRTEGFTLALKEIGYQGIRKGDLVIHEMDAFAGAIGVSDSDGKSTPVYTVCTPRKDANTKYYAYLLKMMAYNGFIQSLAKGIRERSSSFSFNVFQDLELPYFPLPEQQAIADFLDRKTAQIDSLIEKKQRQIDLLQEQRTALINHAVTKGLNPDVRMKDSGVEWLGEIPSHWEVKRMKWLCNIKRGASPRPIDDVIYFDENGEYAWVRISNVTASEMYLYETDQQLSELGASKSVKLEPNELFVSIAASVGKPIINKIKCCIHDGFVWLQGLEQSKEYYFYIFSGGELYKGLGKIGTQLNLNSEYIANIYVPVPPKNEQNQIVDFLLNKTAQVDSLIKQVEQQIQLYQEYRTALISETVTGKIDVRMAV